METDRGRGAVLTIDLCAEKVRQGDPDRFLAVMSVAPQHRGALFTLFAFNLEIARAPWVSTEPMIAEMRLQFWRDVLDDIDNGKPARAHEVVQPLAELVRKRDLPLGILNEMIDARRWDIGRDAFANDAELEGYLCATSGRLMQLAVRSVTAPSDDLAMDVGFASGLANWFCAIPALEAANRVPLVDGRPEAVRNLAEKGLDRLRNARLIKTDAVACGVFRSAWMAERILMAASIRPERVALGQLRPSEFTRRSLLLWKSIFGRW